MALCPDRDLLERVTLPRWGRFSSWFSAFRVISVVLKGEGVPPGSLRRASSPSFCPGTKSKP